MTRTVRLSAVGAAVLLSAGLGLTSSASAGPPFGPTETRQSSASASAPSSTHGLEDVSMIAADDVWTAGTRSQDGIHDLTWVQHWDGTQWVSMHTPNPGRFGSDLDSITALTDSDVWAVGGTQNMAGGDELQLVEHWDGSTWSVVKAPRRSGRLVAVDAPRVDDVWAVGSAPVGAVLEHWDGSTWRIIKAAVPPVTPPWTVTQILFYGVQAVSPRDVWAVGTYDAQTDGGGYDRQPLIEHWNGNHWSVQTLSHEPSFGYLFDIDESAPDDIWAVGTVDFGSEGDTLVEHWDGSSWTATTTPVPKRESALTGVTALSPDDVWAVGTWHWHSQYHVITQHWDGSQWTVVPAVEPSPRHDEMASVTATASDDVLAVGDYVRGTTARGLAERWNGSEWTIQR